MKSERPLDTFKSLQSKSSTHAFFRLNKIAGHVNVPLLSMRSNIICNKTNAIATTVFVKLLTSIDFKNLNEQISFLSDENLQQKTYKVIDKMEVKITKIIKLLQVIKSSQSIILIHIETIENELNRLSDVKDKNNEDIVLLHHIISSIADPCKKIRDQIKNQILDKDDAIQAEEVEWKIFSLPYQQQLLMNNSERKQDFVHCLQTVNEYIKKKRNDTNVSLFISYSWPTSQHYFKEYWVQNFLKMLRMHLRAIGITAILDIVDNPVGGNIIKFMEQAQHSNYVLIMCTESLMDKHLNGHGLKAVAIELNNITRKGKVDAVNGLKRVLPFLITGTHSTSYPANYELYNTIRDMRGKNYIEFVKNLTKQIYNIKDAKIDEIFNSFFSKHPILASTPSQKDVQSYMHNKHSEEKHPISYPILSDTLKSNTASKSIPWEVVLNSVHQQWWKNREMILQLQKQQVEARLYLYAEPKSEELMNDKDQLQKIEALRDYTNELHYQIKFMRESAPNFADQLMISLSTQQQQLNLIYQSKLSLLYFKQRKYKKAKELLDNIIVICKEFKSKPIEGINLNEFQSALYNLYAKILRTEGDYTASYNCYQKALSFTPDDPIILSSIGALLNDQAFFTSTPSLHVEAIKFHRLAEKNNFQIPLSQKSLIETNLGRGLHQLANTEKYSEKEESKHSAESWIRESITKLSHAIELNPKNITAYLFRGIAYMDQKQLNKALEDIETVLKHQITHSTALRRKALILEMQGETSNALNTLKQAMWSLKKQDGPEHEYWLKELKIQQDRLEAKLIDMPNQAISLKCKL